jgi:CDI toxin RNase A-like protein
MAGGWRTDTGSTAPRQQLAPMALAKLPPDQRRRPPAGWDWPLVAAITLLLASAVTACHQSHPSTPATASADAVADHTTKSPPRHDLSADEALGGHTLARHVGKTDDELRERLRREPGIASASTYTDRATAESVVGEALSSAPRSFDSWRRRTGRRPNFVIRFGADRVIGRSIRRGRREATSCEDALIVVRWDDRRQRFYVLTSYPEERR